MGAGSVRGGGTGTASCTGWRSASGNLLTVLLLGLHSGGCAQTEESQSGRPWLPWTWAALQSAAAELLGPAHVFSL